MAVFQLASANAQTLNLKLIPVRPVASGYQMLNSRKSVFQQQNVMIQITTYLLWVVLKAGQQLLMENAMLLELVTA